MNILKKSLILIVSGLFLLSGISYAQVDVQQDMDAGKASVNKIFSTYSNYSKLEFESIISNDFMPVRSEFMNSVDTAAVNQQAVEFDFSIQQDIILDQKMAVRFEWNKKFTIAGTPGQQKAQGKSQLVFQKEEDQWKLIKISGDNPF